MPDNDVLVAKARAYATSIYASRIGPFCGHKSFMAYYLALAELVEREMGTPEEVAAAMLKRSLHEGRSSVADLQERVGLEVCNLIQELDSTLVSPGEWLRWLESLTFSAQKIVVADVTLRVQWLARGAPLLDDPKGSRLLIEFAAKLLEKYPGYRYLMEKLGPAYEKAKRIYPA